MEKVTSIRRLYDVKRQEIPERLEEFGQLWLNGDDDEVFGELAFCILTPQSKAKICWDAILRLRESGLLLKGDYKQIERKLLGVRFKNKKAEYIVGARRLFTNNGKLSIKPIIKRHNNVLKCREWIVKNIKGIGYKEASHFLRNIGFGEEIAILDRHILKNLKLLGVIEHIPQSLSKKTYLQIEESMKQFARQIEIPLSHLDLLFWCKETGEIFK
ncbi:MAG: N-glycosylase/DNA lyase [Nitrospirae bacterium]|nr:N-glycosylase/DNA lyase [Nitrospirota bacterium]